MTRIVALDIGGTNARFALATVRDDGTIDLGEPVTMKTDDHASLETAWQAFAAQAGEPLPDDAAIAIAGPVTGETVRMTNNSWTIRTGSLDDQLGIERVTVLNDFAAVAHAVAICPPADLIPVAGPDRPLPDEGTISVIGPGTGLGVAQLHRTKGGYQVQATEGGHIDFAPVDAIDDALLARLRARHRRVSAERIVSGPGIVDIHAVLAAIEGREGGAGDDRTIWQRGIAGEDALSKAAVERFCQNLGSVAGDFALAHGASGVVIAGGLGYRLRDTLARSGFASRFRFKGRYEQMMAGIPVKLITYPQPGLLGAAAAFVREHLA